MRYNAEFRWKESNHCRNIAIFRFFGHGGRSPIWIFKISNGLAVDTVEVGCVFGPSMHEDHLMDDVVVQNLVGTDAVVTSPSECAKYCDEYVCLFVCLFVCLSACLSVCLSVGLSSRISRKLHSRTSPNLYVDCDRGSVLFLRRCDTFRDGSSTSTLEGLEGQGSSKGGAVTRQKLSVIMFNYAVFGINQHMICKFSSHMSN